MAQQKAFLKDLRALVTTLSNRERSIVLEQAAAQGAIVLTNATPSDPPHVIITRRPGSPKYISIMRRNPRTPVVTPEWLYKSIEAGKRLPYADFAVKPLQDLVICFSGLKVDLKRQLSKQVIELGGKHSASLDKTCSHLVTISTDSDKYRWAKMHNILTVTPLWLTDTISQGWYQDEKSYLLNDEDTDVLQRLTSGAGAGSFGGSVVAATGNATFRNDASGGGGGLNNNTMNTEGAAIRKDEGSMSMKESLVLNDSAVYDGDQGLIPAEPSMRGSDGALLQQHQQQQRTSSRLAGNESAPLLNKPLALPATHHRGHNNTSNKPQSEFAWDDLHWDDSIPPFLDACSLWTVGLSETENFDVVRGVRQGAAKRYLHPLQGLPLTHIIIGSSMNSTEAKELQRVLQDHRTAALVSVDWLKRSVARREMLPADDRFALSQSALNEVLSSVGVVVNVGVGGSRRGGGAASVGHTAYHAAVNGNGAAAKASIDGDVHKQQYNTHGDVNGGIDRQQSALVAAATTVHVAPNIASTGCFAGHYFTLAALKADPQLQAKAERLVRGHGGRIFNNALPTHVQAGTSKAFAICPPSLTLQQTTALAKTNPDFAAVEEANRFTLYWLECCIEAKALLPYQRGSPCYKPLPYNLPLPGMDTVFIAISGYNPVTRTAIQKCVEIVGGQVSPQCMSAKNTHLVVDAARGEKYEHAARFKVIPVTADWLVDSIMYGRLQPEQSYKPRAVAGSDNVVVGSATNHSCGGLSQIGGTQFASVSLPAGFTSMYQAAVGSGAGGGDVQKNESQAVNQNMQVLLLALH